VLAQVKALVERTQVVQVYKLALAQTLELVLTLLAQAQLISLAKLTLKFGIRYVMMILQIEPISLAALERRKEQLQVLLRNVASYNVLAKLEFPVPLLVLVILHMILSSLPSFPRICVPLYQSLHIC